MPGRSPSSAQPAELALTTELFRPGMRVAAAVSGGADSVALLRSLLASRESLGLVLSIAHLHHGIRGEEADQDAEFVAGLAAQFGLPLYRKQVDTPAEAHRRGETLEEAARRLRYRWFADLMASGLADAVATGHTLDDQAETVLHRILRGAWTEGLSGIHPVVRLPASDGRGEAGLILRPMVGVRRAEIEAWLRSIGQGWREDSTNRDDAFTRNRIRHQLLPLLAEYNPHIAGQLAQMATLARDEEAYWGVELKRILPSLVLPGRALRGGGRATSTHPEERSVAVEVERLPSMDAVRRRVLRAAAAEVGLELNFDQTELLMSMCAPAREATKAPRTAQLNAEVKAERTARELRLLRSTVQEAKAPAEHSFELPGEVAGLGVRLRVEFRHASELRAAELETAAPGVAGSAHAVLRTPRAGDRVQLRHSRGLKRVKEVLERLGVPAGDRAGWPVLEWRGQIVWMRGADLEGADGAGLVITEQSLTE